MRVCQFRHDGNSGLQCSGGRKAAESGRSTLLFYSPVTTCQTLAQRICISGGDRELSVLRGISQRTLRFKIVNAPVNKSGGQNPEAAYPSSAVIEIFAFNTFDTGQPFSAASAYF